MFDYTKKQITEDIKAYIKKGCYPFCHVSGFAAEVEAFVSEDLKQIERLCNNKDFQTLFVNYDRMIQREDSGLRKKSYDDAYFLDKCYALFGTKTLAVLENASVCRFDENGKMQYTKYVKEIGGNFVGRCFSSGCGESIILWSPSQATPLFSAATVYHEACHVLQKRYNCFSEFKQQVIDYADKTSAGEKISAKEKEEFREAEIYHIYQTEAHADVFAFACVLLKLPPEDYDRNKALLLKASKRKFVEGAGTYDAFYNTCPVLVKMLESWEKQGRENVRRNFMENGECPDFEKLVTYTEKLVKKYGYDKEQFLNYFYFDEDVPEDKRGFEWFPEYAKAKKDAVWTKGDSLLDFYNDLQSSTTLAELWHCFNENDTPEIAREVACFRRMYEKHNARGRLYAKKKRFEISKGAVQKKMLKSMGKGL